MASFANSLSTAQDFPSSEKLEIYELIEKGKGGLTLAVRTNSAFLKKALLKMLMDKATKDRPFSSVEGNGVIKFSAGTAENLRSYCEENDVEIKKIAKTAEPETFRRLNAMLPDTTFTPDVAINPKSISPQAFDLERFEDVPIYELMLGEKPRGGHIELAIRYGTGEIRENPVYDRKLRKSLDRVLTLVQPDTTRWNLKEENGLVLIIGETAELLKNYFIEQKKAHPKIEITPVSLDTNRNSYVKLKYFSADANYRLKSSQQDRAA